MFNKKTFFIMTFLLISIQPLSYAPIKVNNNSSSSVKVEFKCEDASAIDPNVNKSPVTVESGKKASIRMKTTKCSSVSSISKITPTITSLNGTTLKNSDALKSADYQAALHINDGDTINIQTDGTYAIARTGALQK